MKIIISMSSAKSIVADLQKSFKAVGLEAELEGNATLSIYKSGSAATVAEVTKVLKGQGYAVAKKLEPGHTIILKGDGKPNLELVWFDKMDGERDAPQLSIAVGRYAKL